MRVLLLLFFAGIAVVFGLQSCSTDKACTEATQSFLTLKFYSMQDVVADTQKFVVTRDSTVNILSIYPVGKPDSVLYSKVAAGSIALPLSQVSDTTEFVTGFENSVDTLLVKYTRVLTFVSYECGFRTDFHLDTLISLRNTIDSIYIKQPFVTDHNEIHVQIFYRPDSGSSTVQQ